MNFFSLNGGKKFFNLKVFLAASLRPQEPYLRSRGVGNLDWQRLVIYFDDILILNSCPIDLISDLALVRTTLEEVGFTVNLEKSVIDPSMIWEFLGLILDRTKMTISLTETNTNTILSVCKSFLTGHKPTLWVLASLLLNFTWAIAAISYAQAHYRGLQRLSKFLEGQFRLILSSKPFIRIIIRSQQLECHVGKGILSADPDLTIFPTPLATQAQADFGHLQNGSVTLMNWNYWPPSKLKNILLMHHKTAQLISTWIILRL